MSNLSDDKFKKIIEEDNKYNEKWLNDSSNVELAKKIDIKRMAERGNFTKCKICKKDFEFDCLNGTAKCNCGVLDIRDFADIIYNEININRITKLEFDKVCNELESDEKLSNELIITEIAKQYNLEKCPACYNDFTFENKKGSWYCEVCKRGGGISKFIKLISYNEAKKEVERNGWGKYSNKNKIYMAGKISLNDWRHSIVGLRGYDYWGSQNNETKRKFINFSDNLTYVGPFFISCDHGCSHGKNTHGVGKNNCVEKTPTQEEVFLYCSAQILISDYIFCWIDSLDCYATLFELGFAWGEDKKIFIGIDNKLKQQSNDLWFIKNCGECNYCNSPDEAWKKFLDWGPEKISEEEKENFTKKLSELKDNEKQDYEDLIKREPMSKVIRYFKRDQSIVSELKKLYNGKCQVENCGYTFKKTSGENYCETHHINSLCNKGDDDIKNMICICPNHHKLLHYGTSDDIEKLKFQYKEEHYNLIKNLGEGSNGDKK